MGPWAGGHQEGSGGHEGGQEGVGHEREGAEAVGREAGSESWQQQPGFARQRWQLPRKLGR